VTALQIDTEASRQAARTWATWADQINDAQLRVGGDIDRLGLARSAMVCSRLAAAATGLWTSSGFLTLLVARLAALDGGAPALHESALDELMWLAGGRRGSVTACPPEHYSGVGGDPGDTFLAELRSPYDLAAADPSELGRQLVMRALGDTATPGQIRKDEFEIVRLTDGRYLVALPGVVDLTHPGLGLDPDSRSVRDLDRSALRSSIDTSIGGNAYARMVSEALVAQGVPLGSRLVLVGHSFGADTVLDLASDSGFNGPGGFDVTHVVAAAYDSQPQLDDIPSGTHVLALQNRDDVPVLAEAAEHVLTRPVEDVGDIAGSLAELDLGGVGGGLLGAVKHAVETSSPVFSLAPRADDVVGDLWHGHFGDAAEDAVLPIPSVDRPGERQIDVIFDGGFQDFGHHQDRYIDFVETTSDPLLLGFFGSLAIGTTATGTAVAVDVSVPEKKKRDAQKT
jgi:hypothetical protein